MQYSSTELLSAPLPYSIANDIQLNALGYVTRASTSIYSTVANTMNAGGGFIKYVRFAASATPPGFGRLVHLDKDFLVSDSPITGNSGRPVAVVITPPLVNQISFGWVALSGIVPVQVSAASVAGPMFNTAIGQGNSTGAAGRQVLNSQILIGSAAAITKSGRVSLSREIVVADLSGIFPGQTVTGSGIPASTVITSIDYSTGRASINNLGTAISTTVLTFTNTGFAVAEICYPFIQGQIT